MNYIKDIVYVNKESFLKAIKSLKKSWQVIFVGLAYGAISVVLSGVLSLILRGPLSILSGIISAIIISSLFSNYLYLLTNIIKYGKISFDDFKNGFTYYLRKIYVILFIIYIAQLLLSVVTRMMGPLGGTLISLASIGAFILLNALPETIYQKYYGPLDTISYSYSFLTENILNWAIPNIIFFGILSPLVTNIFSMIFVIRIGFLPGIEQIIIFVLGQLIFNFGMIYRGHLFDLLSTSTRRKREFMKKL